MEEAGYIAGYATLLDREQLGFGVLAFVSVTFCNEVVSRRPAFTRKFVSVLKLCAWIDSTFVPETSNVFAAASVYSRIPEVVAAL